MPISIPKHMLASRLTLPVALLYFSHSALYSLSLELSFPQLLISIKLCHFRHVLPWSPLSAPPSCFPLPIFSSLTLHSLSSQDPSSVCWSCLVSFFLFLLWTFPDASDHCLLHIWNISEEPYSLPPFTVHCLPLCSILCCSLSCGYWLT